MHHSSCACCALQPSGFFAFDPEHGQVVFDVPLEKRSYLVNNTKTQWVACTA